MSRTPYDRGDSDAYYGRPPNPHKWDGESPWTTNRNLTPEEVVEYWRGFDENPSDRKDYG